MRTRHSSITLVASLFVSLGWANCSSDADPSSTTGSGGQGGQPSPSGGGGAGGEEPDPGAPPPKEFARYCENRDWSKTIVPAKVGALAGEYVGKLEGLGDTKPFKKGTLETMKVIPPHPFRVRAIRVAFAAGTGPARIRLVKTFGRTYPSPWPGFTKDTSADVIPPIEVDVTDASPETWLELDVSAAGAYLEPTQHYMLVYEHLQQGPFLGLESLPQGEYSRALLFMPNSNEAYGLAQSDGTAFNYRLELVGDEVCAWTDEERHFSEDLGQDFASVDAHGVALIDVNGDGKLDLVANDGSPRLFLGDAKGHFTKAPGDPWPDAERCTMALFGDLDGDGDADMFAAPYVGADSDGDGARVTGAKPDCDDADAAVGPSKTEILGNGKDDDCNGVVDDGKDTSDADQDGVTVAAGDCDDTRADVAPGKPELLDARDNDCDGAVDQTFVNRILRNDGKGSFTRVPNAGVEALDPSTAAALGDGNADGKLDVYWGNWLVSYPNDPAVQDRYFTGNGDGTFTDAQAAAGLVLPKAFSAYGVEWTDFNNDGHQDIFVGNYHLYDNQLWQNQGDGTFVDVALAKGVAHDGTKSPYPQYPGGHTYGAAWEDFDNDGDLDAFIANLSHPRTQPWADPSMFVVNQGAPDFTFVNQRAERGFLYDEGDVHAAGGDYDNDGDLDLAVASTYTGHYTRLYRNDGDAGFTDVTYETHTAAHVGWSVAWVDVDDDGDLDLFSGTASGLPSVHLFVNRTPAAKENHWLELDLVGTKTNRDAIGARVIVKAGGITRMRDVQAGSGPKNAGPDWGGLTQAPRRLHFGLGKATAIDELTVRWVGGATETVKGAAADGRYRIVEGSGIATKP